MMPFYNKICYDDLAHKYFWGDREIGTSVTQLINSENPFDADVVSLQIAKKYKRLKNPTYVKIVNNITNKKEKVEDLIGKIQKGIKEFWNNRREIGNEIHLISDRYLTHGIEYDGEKYANHWNSLKQFYNSKSNFKMYCSEWKIVHPTIKIKNKIGLGGTIDITFKNDNIMELVDIKTTDKINRRKMEKWKQQLGLYNYILKNYYKENLLDFKQYTCNNLYILKIHPEHGNYEVFKFTEAECDKEIIHLLNK